jgi:hypothetical protein
MPNHFRLVMETLRANLTPLRSRGGHHIRRSAAEQRDSRIVAEVAEEIFRNAK